jgi:hypothetical protein
MRKLIVYLSTGYCGMDEYTYLEVPEDWTDRQIDDETWAMACEHAESYGYPDRDFEEQEDEADWDYDEWYSNHVNAEWEDYDPEKHDMYRGGGGSFSEDFN